MGRELQQGKRGPNVVPIFHPKADPPRARKNMVRQGAVLPDELSPIRRPNKTIKQAVTVNVAAFGAVNEKADSTEAMDAPPHSGPSRDRRFDCADRAKPVRMKKTGEREQDRVE